MTDVTANATVYPSANDLSEVEDEGLFATEQRHTSYIENLMQNHVVSGFVLPASDPDLTITIPAGTAVIDGRRVIISTTTDLLLTDAATNHIFMQLSFDGDGDVDGVDIVANTSGTPPASSVKIGEAVAAAGAITGTTDTRPLGPYRESKVFGPALAIDLGGDTGGAVALVGGGGDTTLAGLSISISREDLQGIDTRVLFIGTVGLEGLTVGGAVTFRIKDGATVLATASHASLQTGDMRFTVMGAATLSGDSDHTITMTGAIGAGNASAQDGQIQCVAIGKG